MERQPDSIPSPPVAAATWRDASTSKIATGRLRPLLDELTDVPCEFPQRVAQAHGAMPATQLVPSQYVGRRRRGTNSPVAQAVAGEAVTRGEGGQVRGSR